MTTPEKKRRDELEQFKIDREQLAWRIIRVMIIGGALSWTRERLVWELIETDSLIQASLAWLLKQAYTDDKGNVHTGFVQCRNERWWKTRWGEEAYHRQARSKRFRIGLSDHEFRVEALTGMDARGNRSALSRAALPSSSTPYTCNPEEILTVAQCSWARRIRRIAQEIGLSLNETADGLKTGRVKMCRGFGDIPAHWGIFHAHNGKNGKRWQYICKDCWRTMKKQRRAK